MAGMWQRVSALLILDAVDRIRYCERFDMPPLADDVHDVLAFASSRALDEANG